MQVNMVVVTVVFHGFVPIEDLGAVPEFNVHSRECAEGGIELRNLDVKHRGLWIGPRCPEVHLMLRVGNTDPVDLIGGPRIDALRCEGQ